MKAPALAGRGFTVTIVEFLTRLLIKTPVILLGLIGLCLALTNYTPNTWLSGWDTLHPEFNLSLSLKRAIFGVWQEHQGLGATASQAHPAEIPRIIILAIFSLILPSSFLRYFYFFLCLIFGPLGVYFFLERIVFNNHPKIVKSSVSFLGSLFYLLNLGTLQHFYVPLEMFTTHYASLGWLFLLATKFLKTKNKKYFGLFSIATFLSTPMAHTATLFYAYFLGLIVYILSFSLFNSDKNRIVFLKRGVILILATLVINSFWLLPNLYFVLNHGQEVVDSKIHRLFSYEAILHSKEFTNIKNAAVLKSFLFNWGEHVGGGKFGDLLDEWKLHLKNPLASSIGYFCFALIILGLILSLIKKNKQGIIQLPLLIFSFFFIIFLNPGFEKIYIWLATKIPLLQEALRFPFTKFSILLMFCYATYFSLAISHLFLFLNKLIKREKLIILSILVLITGSLIFYMLPAFQGNLISPNIKVKIPNEYFQMFDWFNEQEEGRIAKLPVHTFWGWVYHDWGFQGAGFIWFGIKQPVLDREFDRWSHYNEQYYREMSYAVYSQNLSLLENILDKYQIRWILLDESVIAPGNEKKVLFYEEINEILNSSLRINLVKKFGDKLKVFKFDLDKDFPSDQFIQLTKTENITNNSEQKILNQIPTRLNPLITSELLPRQIIPFEISKFQLAPELCSNQDINQVFGVSLETNGFRLLAKNSVVCVKFPLSLIFDKILNKKILFEVKFDYQPETDEKPLVCLFDNRLGRCAGQRFPNYYFELEDSLDNYQLQFSLDAVGSNEEKRIFYKNIDLILHGQVKSSNISELIEEAGFFDITLLNRSPEICSAFEPQHFDRKIVEEDDNRYIEYLSEKGSVCDHFTYPQLSHNQGYALVVESRNLEGLPLRLCLTNYESRRCDIYTELPRTKSFVKFVYLIPPMGNMGQGYDVNINNHSIGKTPSVNHLKSIQIFPLNLEWIQLSQNPLGENNLVVLNQSFEKNWATFEYKKPFSIRPLKSHVLVNGWANGWRVESSPSTTNNPQIYFVFLPQLLEYFGFFLLLILGCSTAYFLLK